MNILQGGPRNPLSSYREREREHYDAQPVHTFCAFCDWSFKGAAAVSREKAKKHRERKHPEAVSKRSRRNVRSLGSFRYAQMDAEDRAVIERERKKRAHLHGVTLEE